MTTEAGHTTLTIRRIFERSTSNAIEEIQNAIVLAMTYTRPGVIVEPQALYIKRLREMKETLLRMQSTVLQEH